MYDRLYEILGNVSKEALRNIMFAALDEMQSYNGQSVELAILRTIGVKKGEKWGVPGTKRLNEEWRDNAPIM